MLKFSIKNVFRKKGVTILASSGIGFGLMLMFVLGAFSDGVEASFSDSFSKILGVVDVTQQNRQGEFSNLPKDVLDKLLAANFSDDIGSYSAQTQLPTDFTLDYLGKLNSAQDSLVIIGVDPEQDQLVEGPTTRILQGRSFQAGQNETIIDSRLLDAAQFDVSLGTKLSINLNATIKEDLTIVGVYEQEDSGAPDFVPRTYYLYTDLETAWKFWDQAGYDDRDQTYTTIVLQFRSTDYDKTLQYIEDIKYMSSQGEFGDTRVEAFSLAQFQRSLQENLSIISVFTTVISLITALAGGMAIIVSQLMSVMERMKEFAILKSTGWKNRHIFQNIVYESLTMGLLGALFGLGLGFGLISLFSSGFGPFGSINAVVTFSNVALVVGFALLIGVIGGLYPGIKAARVRPVKVIKGD